MLRRALATFGVAAVGTAAIAGMALPDDHSYLEGIDLGAGLEECRVEYMYTDQAKCEKLVETLEFTVSGVLYTRTYGGPKDVWEEYAQTQFDQSYSDWLDIWVTAASSAGYDDAVALEDGEWAGVTQYKQFDSPQAAISFMLKGFDHPDAAFDYTEGDDESFEFMAEKPGSAFEYQLREFYLTLPAPITQTDGVVIGANRVMWQLDGRTTLMAYGGFGAEPLLPIMPSLEPSPGATPPPLPGLEDDGWLTAEREACLWALFGTGLLGAAIYYVCYDDRRKKGLETRPYKREFWADLKIKF